MKDEAHYFDGVGFLSLGYIDENLNEAMREYSKMLESDIYRQMRNYRAWYHLSAEEKEIFNEICDCKVCEHSIKCKNDDCNHYYDCDYPESVNYTDSGESFDGEFKSFWGYGYLVCPECGRWTWVEVSS